jgi:hypothetical protein
MDAVDNIEDGPVPAVIVGAVALTATHTARSL